MPTPAKRCGMRQARLFALLIVVAVATALLPGFGSAIVEETVATFWSVAPLSVLVLTWTVKVNEAFAPDAREGSVQDNAPPLPTDGVVQVQPPGALSDWKVVPD